MKNRIDELKSEISDMSFELDELKEELTKLEKKEITKQKKETEKKGIVINIGKDGKEWFKVPEEWIKDYDKSADDFTWEIKGETFDFVDRFSTDGDGEWYGVIVKRERDGKFFEFNYGYGDTRNFYEENWHEVKPKKVKKTEWK